MPDRAIVRCNKGEVEVRKWDQFHFAGEVYEVLTFDQNLIACLDEAGNTNWFDPSFVAEKISEEAVAT